MMSITQRTVHSARNIPQAGMGYFVLVKEGPDFVALPVKDWYNFKPANRSGPFPPNDPYIHPFT